MKQKQGYKILILLMLSFLGLSCKKYLDEKPNPAITIPSTLKDFQALLDNSANMNTRQSPSAGESSNDEYFAPDAYYASLLSNRQNIYIWNKDPYGYGNDWQKCYLPVYNANFALEGLEKIEKTPGNEAEWNNARGCALFFRSINFLNLLWVYSKAYDVATADSDLGIVLRLNSDFNLPSVRSNVSDGYNQVLKDAKEAAQLMPDLPVHVQRPSKAAAYALLARAYLSMRIYDSAYKYSDLSLAITSNLIDFNGDPDIVGGLSANVPFRKFNKETIFHLEMNTFDGVHTAPNVKADSNFYASFQNDDLRRTGCYRLVAGYYQYKGSYTATANHYFTGLTTAENFIIRAESNARAGRITQAMSDLNTLRRKRWRNTVTFPPLTASTVEQAIDLCLLERRKELYMRGVRWIDIKRLNKEGRNIVPTRKVFGQIYTLQPNANYYALPLPDDIIRQTGIPQNPR